MKLFHLLTFGMLIGFFGIGCFGGESGGDPADATPTESPSIVIHSQVTRSVTVKSGDESVVLTRDKCVAVKKDQFDQGLTIIANSNRRGDVVLCGGEEADSPQCSFESKTVAVDAAQKFTIKSAVVSGCSKILGQEPAETEESVTEESVATEGEEEAGGQDNSPSEEE